MFEQRIHNSTIEIVIVTHFFFVYERRRIYDSESILIRDFMDFSWL